MEDTESVATIRVSMVVSELTKLSVLRADVGVVRRSHGSQLGVIPVTIAIRTSSMVISELVIRMSNPEGGRSLISIDKGEGGLSLDDQVAIDQTLGLSSILDEDGMTHGVVSHIVLYLEIVYSMESNCTIVGLMNGIVASVGLVYSADHVEVDRIPTQTKCLACIPHLDILNMTGETLITFTMHKYLCTILCWDVTSVLT